MEYADKYLINLIETSVSMNWEKEKNYWKDLINQWLDKKFKKQLCSILLEEKIKLQILDNKMKKLINRI
jgi:GTP-binding protein EngB required for normal cell division